MKKEKVICMNCGKEGTKTRDSEVPDGWEMLVLCRPTGETLNDVEGNEIRMTKTVYKPLFCSVPCRLEWILNGNHMSEINKDQTLEVIPKSYA